ncbi:MAG: alpha/beta hydrolase [Candidatus Berkelbacteria bacterium]|nr:alpha/beta hydrolase [Candidatus Berkelbacteria bacterium]
MQKIKKSSKIKHFIKWLLIVVLCLIVIGFVYEQMSEYVDAKTLKSPGQLIQVGDHKMHIYCTGENKNGNPTVIFEAGDGDNYTTWHKVQPEISIFTKVCSYDRSGVGFSEGTTDQRTNDDVVTELETLLKNANVGGPYIMVGHSLGGFYTRLFTAKNLTQVDGLVQIDPSVEQLAPFENESIPVIGKVQNSVIDSLFRMGVARIVMHIDPSIANIDSDVANIEIAFNSTAVLNPKNKFPDGNKAFHNINEIESTSNFGSLPVIVLSADQSQQDAITAFGSSATNWQSDLAKKLSNNSKYIMVQNCSHYIQKDQPQIVIDSIKSFLK